MAKHSDHDDVLVVRPWTSTISGGDAYAHFDALVMRRDPGMTTGRYGDFRVLLDWADHRQTSPRPDNFRFRCQTDDRRAEAYAWQWGYQGQQHGIFTVRDLEQYGASIGQIKRAMDRMYREDGASEGVGRFVIRLARALKLDGIVLIETSSTGTFRDDMTIRRHVTPSGYGQAVSFLDDLVLELHRDCARRLGKTAA